MNLRSQRKMKISLSPCPRVYFQDSFMKQFDFYCPKVKIKASAVLS